MFSPTSAPGTTVFKMAAVHRLEFVKKYNLKLGNPFGRRSFPYGFSPVKCR